MSGKNVLIVSEIKGVPIDPNAQDDNLRGDIFALDRKIAQNDSDKRAIQRMTDDKRITPKQASTANQRIDADNAKLKEKRSELKEKLKKNEAARAAKQSTATKAADKPVVPNVQGLLFSRRVSVDQIINNALGRDQGYQCTADKPLKQVLQERFNDHLSGRFPLPPQESLKLRADLQAEFDREHPGQQSAWPAYSNDERAYIRDEAEKKAAHDNNLTIATQSAFAGGAVAAGYTAGADPRTVNKFGTAVLAAEGLLGARRGGQGKKSPQNSVPASTRNPQPTTPRPTPQSNAGGAGNGVVVVRSGAANRGTSTLTLGNGDAVYTIDNASGLTLRAEGVVTGPHVGRGKGRLPEPVGGRVQGEHRGHLIPEGGVDNPAYVNIPQNLISEAPASNLGLKKSMDLKASRIAAENPGSNVKFVSEPVRRLGETRPFAVSHYITVDGKVVEAVSVLNK